MTTASHTDFGLATENTCCLLLLSHYTGKKENLSSWIGIKTLIGLSDLKIITANH